MVHISTVNITTRKEHGVFHCPSCSEQRTFQRRIKRRFLTVYFIPVFPLDVASDTVTCQTCQSTYPASVLQSTPQSRQREFEIHLKRALILMAGADQQLDHAAVGRLQTLYRRLTGEPWDDQELVQAIRLLPHGERVSGYLRRVAVGLGEPAKDTLVTAAFLAATLRGEPGPRQLEELAQLPNALQMPELRFRKLVERAVAYEA